MYSQLSEDRERGRCKRWNLKRDREQSMYRPTWFRGAWKSICRVHALEQKGDRG